MMMKCRNLFKHINTDFIMTTLRDGDYMKYLIQYIEKNSAKGYNTDQLRLTLLQQGYTRAAVDRALKIYEERKPKQVVAIEEPKIEPVQIEEPKKKGFFSKIFGIFGKDKPVNEVVNI